MHFVKKTSKWFLILTFPFWSTWLICNTVDYRTESILARYQIGEFKIDLSQSSFGSHFDKRDEYRDLCLTFTSDRRWRLSKDVPFAKERTGFWLSPSWGSESWSVFSYRSDGRLHFWNREKGYQFSGCDSPTDTSVVIRFRPRFGSDSAFDLQFNRISK
jgi:hypothetical protein